MYRKFWLINSLGNRYDLSERDSSAFFYSPSGLGFRRDYKTEQVGASELVTSQSFSLTDITGTILFHKGSTGDKYQAYQDFIQFIKYKPLELHYKTPNDINDYFCDVLITDVTKTEETPQSVLEAGITFHRLSEWLSANIEPIILTNDAIDDGKHYDLVRDYHYAGAGLSDTVINNIGTDDVGFTIIVEGECSNLHFTLTQGGDTYGVCKILGTYDMIRIDSVDKTESIYLENNGSVISNPEAYQDFTVADGNAYITWCKFRVGETILNITMGNINEFNGKITISFRNSYATV